MSLRRLSPGVAFIATFALLTACASGGGAAGSPRDTAMERVALGTGPAFQLPVNTPAVVLNHSTELALSDTQRVQVQLIRRSLDSADAPLRHQLDSLRSSRRPVNPRDMSQEQRDEIRARSKAAQALISEMRDHASAARSRTVALLSADQLSKVVAYEDEAQKRAEEDANRTGGGDNPQQQRRGGRRGGGGGRPPQD